MINDCTAVILAGGDSARMGRDKASLLLDGKTLLQHVAAAMQQVFPHVVVSVRQPRHDIGGWQQICDEYPDAGPLSGLASSLGQVATPWVFAVACDMPFIVPALPELLAGHRGGHQAVVPLVQGSPQPLAAFYASSCTEVLRTSVAGADKSLRRALMQLDVCYVDQPQLCSADPQLCSFFDLDTPQDVVVAMHRGGGLFR